MPTRAVARLRERGRPAYSPYTFLEGNATGSVGDGAAIPEPARVDLQSIALAVLQRTARRRRRATQIAVPPKHLGGGPEETLHISVSDH